MATLYWRGAVSMDVQLAANWTTFRPGLTSAAPPAASAGPTANDNIIFANFSNNAWNPLFQPAGLIGSGGSGGTAVALNTMLVESNFGRNIGIEYNPLQVYANTITYNKGNANPSDPSYATPFAVIRNLNSSCNIDLAPVSFAGDFGAKEQSIVLGGTANILSLGQSTYSMDNQSPLRLFLGASDDSLTEYSQIPFAWAIPTNTKTFRVSSLEGIYANKLQLNLYLGRKYSMPSNSQSTINIFGGFREQNINVERGFSASYMFLRANVGNYGEPNQQLSPYTTQTLTFNSMGATQDAYGTYTTNKAFVDNLTIEGLPTAYNSVTPVDNPVLVFQTGVTLNNLSLRYKCGVLADYGGPVGSDLWVYVKNLQFLTDPIKGTPRMNLGPQCFLIGDAQEVGGGDIRTAYQPETSPSPLAPPPPPPPNASYKVANINFSGTNYIDIV